jgi:hypothetical protein
MVVVRDYGNKYNKFYNRIQPAPPKTMSATPVYHSIVRSAFCLTALVLSLFSRARRIFLRVLAEVGLELEVGFIVSVGSISGGL